MKKKITLGNLGVVLSAIMATGFTSQVAADDYYCKGDVYKGYYDNVYVYGGDKCTLKGTKVGGNVYVEEGGALVTKYAYIEGNIQAYYPKFLRVTKKTYVGGNVEVEKAKHASKVKDSYVEGDVEIEYSYIKDDVDYAWNLSRNHVGGNLKFNYNKAKYGGHWIYGNKIEGNLECYDNYPKPEGSDNFVYGNAEGQCYSLAGHDDR